MATIIKRGPRQWQAKVRKKGYRTISRTFTTKARAERWARSTEAEMEARIFVDSSSADRTTFDGLAERYLADVRAKQKSMQEAAYRLKRLQAEFGRFALTAISASTVCRFRDQRLEEVSPASVRKELLLLRRVLERATKEWGYHLPH